VLVGALVPQSAARLRISVLDVGQGDAILVESSDGPRLLVDGGSDPDLLVRRLDERIPLWDRRLDLVVLTHPHEDHAGGLAGLMPRYRVAALLETGLGSDGAGVRELRAAAMRHGARHARLVQGDAFALGTARVDVVWPPQALIESGGLSTNREVNATSIVLAIRLGQQRALLMGDLEEDRDRQLLEALGGPDEPWELLKVAHHGSATATSETLLEAVRPRLAAISVGTDNEYGHPAPELLERLQRSGAVTWRTDAQGTLSITLDGGGAEDQGQATPRA
jgi:competence protein ComEC